MTLSPIEKNRFGHDEYMYQVLKHNSCTIPEKGLNMVRFHSFYPWHNHEAYSRWGFGNYRH